MSTPGFTTRPGDAPFTERTPRVVAAARLHRRAERERTGRFLAEGAQAVGEALASATVHELFVTEETAARLPALCARADERGVPVSTVTGRAAEKLSDTVTPQGIVAVCARLTGTLDAVLTPAARLVAVFAGIADPGNAGSVLRVADAAGADGVVFAGESVDPHNGKCVRASAGSAFHVPLAVAGVAEAVAACRDAGLRVLAADGNADATLDPADGRLAAPTAWVFGNEAHGIDEQARRLADTALRVPIYGAAESLNLATAAAVCLYASATAHRRA